MKGYHSLMDSITSQLIGTNTFRARRNSQSRLATPMSRCQRDSNTCIISDRVNYCTTFRNAGIEVYGNNRAFYNGHLFSYDSCVVQKVSNGGSVCEAAIASVFERIFIGWTYIGLTWKSDPSVRIFHHPAVKDLPWLVVRLASASREFEYISTTSIWLSYTRS